MNTLMELLERSANEFGPNPALLIKPTFRYRVWTYADIWEDAGRVASYLQDGGVKKGGQGTFLGS